MLGLSVGTDSGVPKLGRNNHKSYDFASKNIGRFHTSGVSGSMKKHTAKKSRDQQPDSENTGIDDQDEKLKKLKDRAKNYVPERLEARQREIEEDTMKLLALEKKLDEVKRQKEMKRRREEGRQQQRLQYSSALTVQRLARRWMLKRHMRAATALQAFLKFAAAKQAVAAATWSIATLRSFVQMIEVKQQISNDLKEAARLTAMATWINVQNNSAATVLEARKQAVQIASHSILVGIHTASLQKTHGQLQKNRLLKKTLSLKPMNSPSARSAQLWALLRKRVTPVMFKFHDTSWRRRTVFTDGYLNPATDMDHPLFLSRGKVSMAEAAVQAVERRKRTKMEEVMRLHKQREEEMRQEKVLRLQMIDEHKKKTEQEHSEQEHKELMNKANKEKSKVNFLRRVENEQSERAKVVNQVREKKDKIRHEREAKLKQESENEIIENKLMYSEDTRFFQNLEKIRKQRLKDYAIKRKLALAKTEKDLQPGPSQVTAGPGYLSARGGKAGGQEELSQQDLAMEEERKMHIWAANDAAMKQRLAARRDAERKEKQNAALEAEMIRKEQELVAMKAQLMLKRAAFMKNKAKKLKDQAQENSKLQQPEGSHGSTSARGRSRGGSRGANRKKSGGSGSGSAPTTARESPTKKQQKIDTIYDVNDPLALDSLQLPRQIEAPDEDWDWHTPRAVGSGKSAISDLRRSKYSPIAHKHGRGKDSGPLVSPGAVRLNSAERLAMACRQEEHVGSAPHPYDQHHNPHEMSPPDITSLRSASVQDLLTLSQQLQQQHLPPSPIEVEGEVLKTTVKLPNIALTHTASEGKINNKMKNIVGKGLLKNKYINDKLENSPYGSLLPKQHQLQHQQPTADLSAKPKPYLLPQTVVAPTATFTAMTRPTRPSLQGINLLTNSSASVKKSVKGDSLMEIVEKAREKLKHDQDLLANQEETSAALIAATAALGGNLGNSYSEQETEMEKEEETEDQPLVVKEKPKLKKKKKIKKKTVVPPPPQPEKEKPYESKVNKRKLINDTYTKIMKAEIQRKAAEKAAAEQLRLEGEAPPQVVSDFFALRRSAAETDTVKDEEEEKTESASHSYWTSVMSGGGEEDLSPSKMKKSQDKVAPPTASAVGAVPIPNKQFRDAIKGKSKPSKKSRHKHNQSQHTDLRETPLEEEEEGEDEEEEEEEEEEAVSEQFHLDEQLLQLNSSPYEQQQKQQQQQQQQQKEQQQMQSDVLQNDVNKFDKQEDEEEEEDDEDSDEEYEEDDYSADEFEDQNELEAKQPLSLGAEFRKSESFGDAYEDELNNECERLRAELEAKMLAKFDL